MNALMQGLKPYLSSKILTVGFLSFASGLPILMTLSTLTYWLSVYGIDKKSIGLMSLTGLPYVFKFIWAPWLDQKRPWLLKHLGRRKSWIVLFQALLTLIFIALAFVNPKEHIGIISLLIFLLASASASQDIVIDAYRIDYLTAQEQSYGSGLSQVTYRIAMLLMGAAVLYAADFVPWHTIFMLIATLFGIITLITLFFVKETSQATINTIQTQRTALETVLQYIIVPLQNFLNRPQAAWILLFIILFKMPDAIAGVLISAFYNEMGYTGAQIGLISKVYGLIATLIGALLSAQIISRISLYQALVASAILMGLTNLGYLLILHHPTSLSLTLAISLENFIGGFASAVFITYLSLLCNQSYSATQYAMLSALAAFALRIFGSFSGFAVEDYGWQNFFIFTAFLFVPALFVLIGIRSSVRDLTNTAP
ncbi:MFS transporter [Wohlfahrtiimonas chitiniclastica]|uniref:AmpG family muropeptide MFS transporter n=1 Tax=Wohlfahrtiimonas chitiniclastica TaxID=400946 RepID=UPI0007B40707|nr:MFS transporter [Wohlfahrtiimonas chitiniclastica]KZS22685.1 protein AmpG [Wohlfahrtiimonas chitiniclastica]MDC7251232.1 AmpG family muropeptide MFS transporter [Wohlfahrtiimonas chitiniclastica]WHR55141.1 MFS transporter [Wohlfahrtiimonas chitiniclastica]